MSLEDHEVSGPFFTPGQFRIIGSALDEAEERIVAFYRIAPREWSRRFPYDLATLSDYPTLAFEGALAQIIRTQSTGAGGKVRFRIVLRDPSILETGRRHGLRRTLLWVLTHELIHVVRFGEVSERFEARGEERQQEESRVRELTRQVLAPAADHRMEALLRRVEAVPPEPQETTPSPTR